MELVAVSITRMLGIQPIQPIRICNPGKSNLFINNPWRIWDGAETYNSTIQIVIRLMEMEVVMISARITRLDVVEQIPERNVNTAVQLYAGGIKCKTNQISCFSRKDVGKHIFRSVVDIYSSIRSTSQGMCLMKGNNLP